MSSAAVIAAVLCLGLGAAGPAVAGPMASLRQGLFGAHTHDGRDPAPAVARYVSEDGDVFTLDRSQGKPLMKFENSGEVWALQAQQAPRGDTIYKNDLGEPVLRATRLGGLTVFTDHRPDGEAAALAGSGNPLRLLILGPQALAERLLQASARASRAARRLIPFEVPDATPASSGLFADAAMVASEAVVRLARHSDIHRSLDRIQRVRLVEGRKAAADMAEGVLLVTVAPAQAFGGRPSSDRIVQVAETSH